MANSDTATVETDMPEHVHEFASVDDVLVRYRLEGPHATVVMQIVTPGTHGDDHDIRWNARRTELSHAGAPEEVLDRLDGLLDSMVLRGRFALLTANADSSAFCWFDDEDVSPSVDVGATPHLVPALQEIAARATMIGAIVDRTGADVFRIGHLERTPVATVEGEREEIHRGAAGGNSEGSKHRHIELLWDRNAALVATEVTRQARLAGAAIVVLTGDDRACRLAEQHLASESLTVERVAAGGRHEPESPQRVDDAAHEVRRAQHRAARERAVSKLREELGQHDLAVAGESDVIAAVAERRVATLFVDLDHAATQPGIDGIVHGAIEQGADVITGRGLGYDDAAAALLRYVYA